MVACETVQVIVIDQESEIVEVTVPAFTVSFEQFDSRLKEIVKVYKERSRATGNLVSLGDFALYAITEASRDPRKQ